LPAEFKLFLPIQNKAKTWGIIYWLFAGYDEINIACVIRGDFEYGLDHGKYETNIVRQLKIFMWTMKCIFQLNVIVYLITLWLH
jgi:hypothetical protein